MCQQASDKIIFVKVCMVMIKFEVYVMSYQSLEHRFLARQPITHILLTTYIKKLHNYNKGVIHFSCLASKFCTRCRLISFFHLCRCIVRFSIWYMQQICRFHSILSLILDKISVSHILGRSNFWDYVQWIKSSACTTQVYKHSNWTKFTVFSYHVFSSMPMLCLSIVFLQPINCLDWPLNNVV